MIETPITAEDLTLYAMHLLDGTAVARVDLLLRSSSEARAELAQIRGDLAAFALSAPQHTPPALTRQRLLKQVAREGRAVPIPVAMQDLSPFVIDTPGASDAPAPGARMEKLTVEERRSRVRLPRILSDPELILDANDPSPSDRARPASFTASLPHGVSSIQPVARRESPAVEHLFSNSIAPPPSRTREAPAAAMATPPPELPEDRYESSTPFARSAYVSAEEARSSRFGNVSAWTGWAAAAALAAAAAFLFYTNLAQQQQLEKQSATLARNGAQVQRADVLMQTLQSSAAQRFVLARQDTAPVPSARVAYLPEHASLIFQGTNLEALAPYKTYELWLIPAGEGRQPMPAGTFRPDARGYATLVLPPLPHGTVAGNFGVTVEDDGGSTTPTLPILLIGQQS